ncbi:Lecithin-cholesterol acyltransferase-like 1 [Rhynchospora pubera]|uniref:Lecithin-cholesterol acyltransferase-like 1 n=1 Tax=Rhynchospora pubera TaxID=906938 RepID=A0AAV8CKU1_9POAL|nr:Lecithin-cholesterol acyltransferase-like 1 [Rhynchospora pubera]
MKTPTSITVLVLMASILSLNSCISMGAAMTMTKHNSGLHPIILIPGSGGNQLEAQLTSDYKPSSLFCHLHKGTGWYRMWFDPTVLVAPLARCFAERMMTYYHSDINDYRNAPGVDTRVPHFGSTKGMLYLDPNLKGLTEYMAPLVSSLEQLGYQDNQTLFGAPYDFRYGLAANSHPSKVGTQYLEDLKALIESAAASNNGKQVILMAHSLGGLFALQLLNRNSLSWRRQFVKHLVTLSTPWGGAVQQMLTFASGNTLGVPLVNPLLVRSEQRSSESNQWILPNPSLFRSRILLISTSNNKTYSSLDMPQFLEDIGFKEGVEPYKARILPLNEKLDKPGVPVTCMVGTDVETPHRLVYGAGGFDAEPQVDYGDGDGTVNLISLLRLKSEWSGSKNQVLDVIKLPGVSHSDILKDKGALEQIIRFITEINMEYVTLKE